MPWVRRRNMRSVDVWADSDESTPLAWLFAARSFNLYVRSSTSLSGPLQAEVNAGNINLIRNLP